MSRSATLRRFERSLVFVVGVAVGVLGAAVVPSLGGTTPSGPRTSSAASSGPIGVSSVRLMESPGDSVCAVLDDGSVRCAGTEGWGELTPPNDVLFQDVVPGRETSCGLTVDGEVRCWGFWSGTVRTGGSVDRIATHGEHALCVIDSGGRLICFDAQELGRSSPISVVGVQNLTVLSNWYLTFCGLDSQGSATCFNADGSRVGDAQRFTAPRGLLLQTIRLSNESACGLDLAGEIHCWGRVGSVGDAPTGPFVDIGVSAESACGLRSDGMVTCWGTLSSQPPRDTRFESITMSAWSPGFACGVTTRGEALCWGAANTDALRRSLAAW